MPRVRTAALAALLLSGQLMSATADEAPLPGAIAAPGETVVLSVHGEGAQVYECKAGNDGKPTWAFREPIATLLADGSTLLLCRVEDRRGLSHLCAARSVMETAVMSQEELS